MISKQNPGAVLAAPKPNGLKSSVTPKVGVVEIYDPEEKIFRVEVVRLAA